jgi:transposase
MDTVAAERIRNTLALLNEKQRRLYLANEAKAIGRGGIKEVTEVSGVSRVTIIKGLKEIKAEGYRPVEITRCRKEGGGRKPIEKKRPEILDALEGLLEPHTKGDPMNPLKWTDKSLRSLEKALKAAGFDVSDTTIALMLKMQGYTLQANRKELATTINHPDRNGQFEQINKTAGEYMEAGLPVISIDAKKKANIGNFKNTGAE